MLPRDILAFDEGERILIVSFLGKSLSRVLRTSPKAIDRNAMRFQALGAILDWLTGWLAGWLAGYVAQIALISCANVFKAALSLRHRFFFLFFFGIYYFKIHKWHSLFILVKR